MLSEKINLINTKDNARGILEVSLSIVQEECDNIIIFDCSLRNIGNADIALGNTFLFIDEGILDNCNYIFPFLQKKFLNIPDIPNEDCAMCNNCRKNHVVYPRNILHIDNFFSEYGNDKYTACFSLPHLSSDSVLYMAPKEVFNETLAVHLSKGVYRAILVSVPKSDNCDCMCKNKCFYVKQDYEKR